MHVRSVGATGLKVSRLGLGTMTWGRDTDEHEARDQLIAFAEAGGSLVDTAAGYGDGASEELIGSLIGDVVARDEIVIATKAGISRRTGTRVTDASRGSLLTALDGSLARLGVDHVDLWQVHTWVDDAPLEETLSALDTAVATGRASYVGVSNYAGLADGPGGDLAAGGPRTGPARVDADGVLPAQPDDRGRGAARRARPRPRRARLVPARPRGADRQVPDRHPRRLAGGDLALLGASWAPTSARARSRSSRPSPAPPTGSAGPRSRSRWPGSATGRASPPPSWARGRPSSCAVRSASRSSRCPTRSRPPSTTSRARGPTASEGGE